MSWNCSRTFEKTENTFQELNREYSSNESIKFIDTKNNTFYHVRVIPLISIKDKNIRAAL